MLGLRKYRFEYPVPPAQAAQSLVLELNKPDWASLGIWTQSGRVKIHTRPPILLHNSFNPIFVGRFAATEEGAALTGVFRMHGSVIVLLLAFFGLVGYEMLQTLSLPQYREGYENGWRDAKLAWYLRFAGVAALVPVLGWVLGARSRNAILRAIGQSI